MPLTTGSNPRSTGPHEIPDDHPGKADAYGKRRETLHDWGGADSLASSNLARCIAVRCCYENRARRSRD